MSQRDERGAAAILIAVSTVLLAGMVAFVTDFGLAYASKRQLQTAADAASLAAASEFAKFAGSCYVLASSDTATAAATAAADAIREENRPDSMGSGVEAECSTDGKRLEVSYSARGDTPLFFGGVFDLAGPITTSRTAKSDVFVPDGVSGLRPYAVCQRSLPAGSGVQRLNYPGSCQETSGGWWQLLCPEQSGPSSNAFAEATLNGCQSRVSIVEGQPEPPADPSSVLIADCPARDDDCLGGNPGNDFSNNKVRQAWERLLGREIVVPVFYDGTIQDPRGSNARFPVHRLLAVKVCGYHWGSDGDHEPDLDDNQGEQWGDTQTGTCAGADASSGGNGENYLLVEFIRVQVSGSSQPSDCALGQEGCDSLREVRLIE